MSVRAFHLFRSHLPAFALLLVHHGCCYRFSCAGDCGGCISASCHGGSAARKGAAGNACGTSRKLPRAEALCGNASGFSTWSAHDVGDCVHPAAQRLDRCTALRAIQRGDSNTAEQYLTAEVGSDSEVEDVDEEMSEADATDGESTAVGEDEEEEDMEDDAEVEA